MSKAPKWFSESQRKSYDEGFAYGLAKARVEAMAESMADALVKILAGRGLRATDDQERRIRAYTELATLGRWLDRSISVASVDELLE